MKGDPMNPIDPQVGDECLAVVFGVFQPDPYVRRFKVITRHRFAIEGDDGMIYPYPFADVTILKTR